jgi:hypothetical protein
MVNVQNEFNLECKLNISVHFNVVGIYCTHRKNINLTQATIFH